MVDRHVMPFSAIRATRVSLRTPRPYLGYNVDDAESFNKCFECLETVGAVTWIGRTLYDEKD